MGAGTLTLLLASTCLRATSFVAVAPCRLSPLVPTAAPKVWRRKVDSPVFQLASSFREGAELLQDEAAAASQRPPGLGLSMGEDTAPLDRR